MRCLFPLLVASLSSLLSLVGCVGATDGDPPGDAGQAFSCEAGSNAEVLLGKTDLGYIPVIDGDILRVWDRPQGGLGARINIAMRDIAYSADLDSIAVRITKAALNAAPLPSEEGGICVPDDISFADAGIDPEDVISEQGCKGRLRCIDDACLLEIVNQRSVNVVRRCIEDQLVIIPEWPIRFFASAGLSLAEYNDMPVDVEVTVTTDDFGEFKARQNVVLEVGDFVEPSWWMQGR